MSDPAAPDGRAPEVRTDADRAGAPRRRRPLLAGLVVAGLIVGGLSAVALSGPGGAGSAGDGTPGVASASPSPGSTSTATREEIEEVVAAITRREEGDPYAVGDVDATIVMVQFSDWLCPFCARWAVETKPELQRYLDDGTLRIEYRDMPLSDQSVLAARAGRAAGEQGRFWEFHDTVFAAQHAGAGTDAPADGANGAADDDVDHSEPGHEHAAAPELDEARLLALAEQAGVPDLARFEADMTDPRMDEHIERDLADARRLGAPGSVPLFVIGEEAMSGAQPLELFERAIDRQVALAEA